MKWNPQTNEIRSRRKSGELWCSCIYKFEFNGNWYIMFKVQRYKRKAIKNLFEVLKAGTHFRVQPHAITINPWRASERRLFGFWKIEYTRYANRLEFPALMSHFLLNKHAEVIYSDKSQRKEQTIKNVRQSIEAATNSNKCFSFIFLEFLLPQKEMLP